MSRYRRDASDLIKKQMARAFTNPNNLDLTTYQVSITPGQISQIKSSFGYGKNNLPCEALCPVEEQQPIETPVAQFGCYNFDANKLSRIDATSQVTNINGSLAPGSGNFTIEWYSKFQPRQDSQISTIFSIGSPSSFNGRIMALTLELSGNYQPTDISNTYNLKFYFYDIIAGPQSVFFGFFSPSNPYFTTALLKNWNHMALVGLNNSNTTTYSSFQFFVNGLLFSPFIIQALQSIYTNPDNGFIAGPQNYNVLIPSNLAYPYLSIGNENASIDGSPNTTTPTGKEFNGCITNFRWTTDITESNQGGLYFNFFQTPSNPLIPFMYSTSPPAAPQLISLTKFLIDGNISYNNIYDISPYVRSITTTGVSLSGDSPPQNLTPQSYGSFYFNKFYRTNSQYNDSFFGNIGFTPMYVDISNSASLQTGTQAFTFEWWQWIDLYTTFESTQQYLTVFSNTNTAPATASTFMILFLYDSISQGVGVAIKTSSADTYFGSFGASVQSSPVLYPLSVLNNKWCHFAVQGDGSGNMNIYFNGIQFGTSRLLNYNIKNPILNSTMRIGDFAASSLIRPQENWITFAGYLAGMKFNIGSMNYTSQFAPPLIPLSKDSNTVLLLNNYLPSQTSQNIYKDSSPYNQNVRNKGTNVTLSLFIPTSTRAQAPSELQISFINSQIFIFFLPGNNGGSKIINYSYSTDGGTTYKTLSPAQFGTSILLTKESSSNNDISNSKTYNLMIAPITSFGIGLYSTPQDISAVRSSSFAVYFTAGTFMWTAPTNVSSVQYLLVGGGGGSATGDNLRAGGGGGGGQVKNGNVSVTPGQSYTITVGAGGAGPGFGQNGLSGQDSTFNAITALGGGGGLAPPNIDSNNRLNGGGGKAATLSKASVGGNSGIAIGPRTGGAGGGGGSFGNGENARGFEGGAGGEETLSNITGRILKYGKGGSGANYGIENGPTSESFLGYGAGGGASLLPSEGGRGGDGCVILRY